MEPSHNHVPSVQSNGNSDQQPGGSMYNQNGQSGFSANNFQFSNSTANGDQTFSSNQFQNTGQGIPLGNEWCSAPEAMGPFQSPMNPNASSANQVPPGHMNQFIPQFPQFPYPANPPGQFMSHCDWMAPDPFFMPPPPFPAYNSRMMPFSPMMGYPTHPFMTFGPPHPAMPFPHIKMEPSPTMDYNMAPQYGQGWQDSSFYGPVNQHHANFYQGSASMNKPINGGQVDVTNVSIGQIEQQNVKNITHPSTHHSDGRNVPKDTSDTILNSSINHKNVTPKSASKDIPSESHGRQEQHRLHASPQNESLPKNQAANFKSSMQDCEFKSPADLNVKINKAPNQDNWLEKLDRTRVKMSFSPKAISVSPCASCFQNKRYLTNQKEKLSVESAPTPSSDDDIIIVRPDCHQKVLNSHILCEKCGDVKESEGIINQNEDVSVNHKSSRLDSLKCKEVKTKRKSQQSEKPEEFLLFSKIAKDLENHGPKTVKVPDTRLASFQNQTNEPELNVYNIGTVSQLKTGNICKPPLLSYWQKSGGSSKTTPGFDITDHEKSDTLRPEICSPPQFSDTKDSVIDTQDTTRKLSMKGIVSMDHRGQEMKSSKSDQVPAPLPPPKKIRICWSCQTQQSAGPWHGHKYRENNFLCGECFEMHKRINAKREEEALIEATKIKEIKEARVEVASKTEKVKKKVITDHNDNDFYLSSPVKETIKSAVVPNSKVEKKSTRFTRQWVKSQLVNESRSENDISQKDKEMSKDIDDDIAKALREMGEGEQVE